MKASEMLKDECCGQLYNTLDGKSDLVKMVEDLEQQLAGAKRESENLALSLYNKHYADEPDAVPFELCDSPAGVITQIDNMVCGLKNFKDLEVENVFLKNQLDNAIKEIQRRG